MPAPSSPSAKKRRRTRTRVLASLLLVTPLVAASNTATASVAPVSGASAVGAPGAAGAPIRTIVTTDAVRFRFDDVASFYRMLLYSNEFADGLEGIVYSSSFVARAGDPNANPPIPGSWDTDVLQRIIRDEYSLVYQNLRLHDPRYPSPEHLLSLVKFGNMTATGEMAKDTEGSLLIKRSLLSEDSRPLRIQVWGGTNTVGAALRSITEEFSSSPQWASLKERISKRTQLYIVLDQDAVFKNYVEANWPELRVVMNRAQFQAVAYPRFRIGASGPTLPHEIDDYFKAPFMSTIAQGPLLANMPRTVGDPLTPDGACYCEGDSPAMWELIDNGLRSYEDPTYGGWGGRFQKTREHRWADWPAYMTLPTWPGAGGNVGPETRVKDDSPYDEHYDPWYPQSRWIPAIQNEFAARSQWTYKSYADSNHEPLVSVAGNVDRIAVAGEQVDLSASATDPDGDTVGYKWWQYREAGTYPGAVTLSGTNGANVSFKVPADAQPGQKIHVILEGTDNGAPALTRYQRVIVTVVSKTDVSGQVGGNVAPTLGLTFGAPASFGAFTPGIAKDYLATSKANVISTAGNATLSVSDASATNTGKLVNGAFALTHPLQVRARNAANTGTAHNSVGSAASPLNLLTWDAPISNDAVDLEYKQSIGANEALRTGSYSKTLTFTLSTTAP